MDVILAKDAQKQYKRLPKSEQIKIRKRLAAISQNPFVGKKLEGELKQRLAVRAWPYRIIYTINEFANRVEVSDILHRQGAYK